MSLFILITELINDIKVSQANIHLAENNLSCKQKITFEDGPDELSISG